MEKRVSIFGDYLLYRWNMVKKRKIKKYSLIHDTITLGGVFITYANTVSSVNKLLPEFDCEYEVSLNTIVPAVVKSNVDEGNNIKYINTESYNLENTILDSKYKEVLTLEYKISEEDREKYVLPAASEISDDVTLIIDLGKGAISKELVGSIKSKVKIAMVKSDNVSDYENFDLVILNKDKFLNLVSKKRVNESDVKYLCNKYNYSTLLVLGDRLDTYMYYSKDNVFYKSTSTSKFSSYKVGVTEAYAGILTTLLSKEEINFEVLEKSVAKSKSVVFMLLETESPLCIL